MIKKEICRKITDLGKYGRRTLVYCMTVDNAESDTPCEEYGIAVRVFESGEECEIRKITTDVNVAEKMLDVFATNYVTPVSLKYVVEDWIAK